MGERLGTGILFWHRRCFLCAYFEFFFLPEECWTWSRWVTSCWIDKANCFLVLAILSFKIRDRIFIFFFELDLGDSKLSQVSSMRGTYHLCYFPLAEEQASLGGEGLPTSGVKMRHFLSNVVCFTQFQDVSTTLSHQMWPIPFHLYFKAKGLASMLRMLGFNVLYDEVRVGTSLRVLMSTWPSL